MLVAAYIVLFIVHVHCMHMRGDLRLIPPLHPTFKESLYPAHLLDHSGKLGVLTNEFLHLPLTGTRPSRHSSNATRLTKHLGSLRVVQLCRCGTCKVYSEQFSVYGAALSYRLLICNPIATIQSGSNATGIT